MILIGLLVSFEAFLFLVVFMGCPSWIFVKGRALFNLFSFTQVL